MKYLNKSILFVVSFIYMGFEMLASRLVTPYFGNTIYTWGAIISIFLLGSTVGYWLGGKNADRNHATTWLHMYFVLGTLMLAFTPLAAVEILPYLQGLSEPVGILTASLILFLLPNLCLSAIIPAITKDSLTQHFSGKNIGSLHAVSAIGSIAGTMITTFILIPNMDYRYSFAIFSGLLTICVIVLKLRQSLKSALMYAVLLIVSLVPINSLVQEQWADNTTIIHRDASVYHDLYVVEADELFGEYGDYRMLLFGYGGVQGAIDQSNPERIAMQYVRNMIDIIDHNKPEFTNGFFIGHGVGTLSGYYEKKGRNIRTAEIDNKVYQISKQYFGYNGDGVVIGDGRRLLEQQADLSQDVIVMDAFNDTSIPFHLTTKEFFAITHNKLKEDGILVMNIVGSIMNDEVLNAIHSTISSVYGQTRVYATNPLDSNDQNVFVIASKSAIPTYTYPENTEIILPAGELITDTHTKFNRLN